MKAICNKCGSTTTRIIKKLVLHTLHKCACGYEFKRTIK